MKNPIPITSNITRIASNKSPWLADTNVGDIYNVPISHGEGRFLADEKTILELAKNGQIATQYVDFSGEATNDIHFNPNDSMYVLKVSPHPTAVYSVRWVTAKESATVFTRTFPATTKSRCSSQL